MYDTIGECRSLVESDPANELRAVTRNALQRVGWPEIEFANGGMVTLIKQSLRGG